MAYTRLEKLKPPSGTGVVEVENSNPIFYDEDRNILKMQSLPGIGKANTTKRVKMSYNDPTEIDPEYDGTNIYVEIGIIERNGIEIVTFDQSNHMAALPCPPLDNPAGGNYVDL